MSILDPIHEVKGKWWFWDETHTDRHGPFASRKEAEANLISYAHLLLTGDFVIAIPRD
jgi:hypothetical protein